VQLKIEEPTLELYFYALIPVAVLLKVIPVQMVVSFPAFGLLNGAGLTMKLSLSGQNPIEEIK